MKHASKNKHEYNKHSRNITLIPLSAAYQHCCGQIAQTTGQLLECLKTGRSAVVLVGFPDPVCVPKSERGINRADREKVSVWRPTYTDTGTKIELGSMPGSVT